MAAYAALVSLMNNIEQMMNHPHISTFFDNQHIQPLVEKAGFLLDYIEGCYNHGGGRGSKEAEDLERRIASAAHAAEDAIESHIVSEIRYEMARERRLCYGLLDLRQVIQDMNSIMKEATEEKRECGEEKLTHTAMPLMESGETAMVGLDDELTQLLHELTWSRPSLHIISIVGMGGTGKTTLANNIYQNSLVKEHFVIRAWATISQQYNAQEIISKLLSCLLETSTSGTLGEKLYKSLYGRRYLIVLDDIWSVEAWNKVSNYFPNNENGSRVVLTTRLSNVANDCGSSSVMDMKLLKEDQSWNLFCEKASFPLKDDHPQLEDIGREIVKSCKGLALSIVVIGGLLLKSPRTVGYWKVVAEGIKSIPDSKEKQESLDVLSLSYSHLPPHLKPCFLYMGVFEEDYEIRISNIVKLWIGEGFIKPNGSQELEEVGEGYIKDLVDRNLVVAGSRRSDGKFGFCGIHDLLRDLSLKIAEEQEFFRVGEHNRQTERRLVDSRFLDLKRVPLARTIIRQGYVDCKKMEKYCRLLRVFERPHGGFEIDFVSNVNLRYLTYGIYCGEYSVWSLSSCISFMWNLQTLIIQKSENHQNMVVVAPDEFWEMRQLRHVECKTIHLPPPPHDEVLMLEKLQTLKTAMNLGLSEEVCNIIPNIKKLYLKYAGGSKGYDDSYIKCLCNLDRLYKLESLKLDYSPTQDTEFNEIVRFPSSLKKLSLRGCGLNWEDMTMIGSLPHLEVLKLESHSVTKGREWRPVDEQFRRLKFLEIEYCELVDWHADNNSHFPVLEKLILRHLNTLKEIPSDIGEIPTLQLIRVIECSDSAAISAIKIKEDRLENDQDDDLQIQVKLENWEERFIEMLGKEGLTLNNIQLWNAVGKRIT